ncbi:hypothetical protein C2G38_2108917 [Gigaspora rosea]|uniref:Uncharacterized protein n=1 Tax=Gigaspora rosea TaxID=44941 RepID=A0A397UPI2_9GLOM|nr:hypothetical protein C2G38_2108917 [Gigaspora rosea]
MFPLRLVTRRIKIVFSLLTVITSIFCCCAYFSSLPCFFVILILPVSHASFCLSCLFLAFRVLSCFLLCFTFFLLYFTCVSSLHF